MNGTEEPTPVSAYAYKGRATIDIAGLDKAEVLAALYNASSPMGMGWLQAAPNFTTEQAREHLDIGDDVNRMFPGMPGRDKMYFDYLRGRPLKVDIGGDTLFVNMYDRDNGHGAALRALEPLLQAAGKPVAYASDEGEVHPLEG